MYASPTPLGPAEIPRAPRHAVRFHVDIKGPTTPAFRGRVRNISASGMLVDAPGTLRVGDVVSAMLPTGEVICTVVRIRGGSAGLRFVTAIDPDSLT